MAIKLKRFSTKSFSDWDQIRDLVKEQYPRLRFRKVDGSETEDSYKVMISDGSKKRIVEIKKNPKKSAIENWVEGSKMKVENTARPKTSDDKISKYKSDKQYREKGYTPEQINLARLAESNDELDRDKVADNDNTPAEILEKLSNDDNRAVRSSVANNPNTPVEVLKKLADDNFWGVRDRVANNPNTPAEVLKELADDDYWGVRFLVANNPNTPVEVLKKLADDNDEEVRYVLADNPNTPVEVLERLADDSDEARYRLTNNPNTPVEVLKKLANDHHKLVRRNAKKRLNQLG